MLAGSLPPEALSRFRAISLERLDRIESAWTQAIQDPRRRVLTGDILREPHTLKGDSRAVGFTDVNLLAHRLEDLVTVAQERGFQLPEDFDLVVGMGLRFLAVLMRKKLGSSLGGIDLNGFLEQVDAVLEEARCRGGEGAALGVVSTPAIGAEHDHVALATLHQLGAAATLVWLEWQAGGRRQARLRRAFEALRAQTARLGGVPLAPRLVRHSHSLPVLAAELGKQAAITIDVGDLELSPQAAEAVDVAVMHSLRNALDHGLERPEARRAAGKPEAGRLRVIARREGDELRVVIDDDGAGIALDRVRERAVELGLGGEQSTEELIALLFRSGFSTRHEVNDVSGRGVGLAAVRAAVEGAGGRISLSTTAGRGTETVLVLPLHRMELEVECAEATSRGLLLAWAAPWRMIDGGVEAEGVDPVALLELGRTDATAPRVLTLGDGTGEVRLRVGAGPPRSAIAERLCATADGEPCEVVKVDEQEGLLLRPRALLGEG